VSAEPPDWLVLGVGGILGEAWLSAVLAGIEEGGGFDARESGGFVGSSAGSIVAAALAAGVSPDARLGQLPEQPEVADGDDAAEPSAVMRAAGLALGVGAAAAAPLAALALSSTRAPGALVRRAALARVPHGRHSLGDVGGMFRRAEWDGRLRIAAVELESGRRVVFGAPGAPAVSVAQAVEASCAIPGYFRPMRAGGRSYVDGGAWSPTSIDAADVARGDRVLCLNPTGSLRPTLAEPAGAIGPLSRAIAAAEALALRRRGARVTTVNPDQASIDAMGSNLMARRGREGVIRAGFEQGRRLARQL
jgi:NTE family protein